MKKLILTWNVLGLMALLGVAGCSKHNPDNPLNPEGPHFVGDAAASADADHNDTADVLQQFNCGGNIKCATDSALSSQAQLISSMLALSSQLAASSAALSSSGATSSGVLGSSAAVSSSSVVTVDCPVGTAPLRLVHGTLVSTGLSQGCMQQGGTVSIAADSVAGWCFDHWDDLPGALAYISGNPTSKLIQVYVIHGQTIVDTQTITANYVNCGAPASSMAASSAAVSSAGTSSALASSSSIAVSSSALTAINYGDTAMVDVRDNSGYTTAKIGAVVWMTANLRYQPSGATAPCANITGTADATVVAASTNAGTDCPVSGRYYTWAQTMAVAPSYNTATYSGAVSQGICPAGWRLPTLADFTRDEATLQLRNTGVLRTGGNFDVSNTGFYWASDVATASTTTTYCQGTVNCGAAWISHETVAAGQYSQSNTKAEGLPVRCVRAAN